MIELYTYSFLETCTRRLFIKLFFNFFSLYDQKLSGDVCLCEEVVWLVQHESLNSSMW